MNDPAEQCRRERILDAAEQAFAEHGFAGASLREIVRHARVNLATVYYYFQSKEGLMEAVLKRRFGPLRAEHLELLERFQRQAGGRPLSVEKILEAMLRPPLRLASAEPDQRHAVTRLVGRIVTEPDPQTQAALRCQRSKVRTAFLEALRASLPSASEADLQWRLELVWGALGFLLCNPRQLGKEAHGVCSPLDAGELLPEMIRFFAPGFRAAGAEARSAPPGKNRARSTRSRRPAGA